MKKPTKKPPVKLAKSDPSHLGELIPDARNARKHGPRNIATIVQALHDVGAARSIVIDEAGTILAGNATCEAAAEAGITKIQVVDADGDTIVAVRRTGLTPAQKAKLSLYDNRAAELAEGWNTEILKELATEIDLSQLFSADELADLLGQKSEGGLTDPDAVPEERPTRIKLDDLFALGHHWLLCGDSTKAEDVARVLGGDQPSLMVTDPPYGVDYDPAWRVAAGVNRSRKKMGRVANDDRADWTEAWRLFSGPVAYVWHAGLKTAVVSASLELAGFSLRAQIVWAKDRMALSRGDYHWQHEPCWYAVREGATAHRTKDRTQTTLWEIATRDDGGHGHGTQKPVECMARPIRNHGQAGDVVYEPFSGSGTTIIACEQLGRRCRAIEIEPKYCQVAIDRWEQFTGKKAVKTSGGPTAGLRARGKR